MPRSTDRLTVTSRTSAELLGAAAIAGAAIQRGESNSQAADHVQANFPKLSRNDAYEIARSTRGYGATNVFTRFQAGTHPLPATLIEPVPGLYAPFRYLIRLTYVDAITGEETHVHHWIDRSEQADFASLVEEASQREAIVVQQGFRTQSPEAEVEVPEAPPVPSLILAQRRV